MRKTIGTDEIERGLKTLGFQTPQAFLHACTTTPGVQFRLFATVLHERVFPGGMFPSWSLFADWKIVRHSFTTRSWRQGGRNTVLREIRQAALSELDDYSNYDLTQLQPLIGSQGPYFARLLADEDRHTYALRLTALAADLTLLERKMRDCITNTTNFTHITFDYRIAFYDHAFEINIQEQSPFHFFNF